MNEVQLLKSQLAAERQHLREVAGLCTAGSELVSPEFTESCANYILFSMNQERARAQALLERSSRVRGPADGARGEPAALHALEEGLGAVTVALGELLELRGTRRAGRGGPGAVGGPPGMNGGRQRLEALGRSAALLERLIVSRLSVQALAEAGYTVEDWRRIARVDADSVLEERRLRAEVLRHGAGPTLD